jgi:hypothetical protein
MLAATCHCGAVRVEVPRRPRRLTNCNCSICHRYGTLWAYYKGSEVRVTCAQAQPANIRVTGRSGSSVHTCGDHSLGANSPRGRCRMGVNARNFEPASLGSVRIRLLDGASTSKYLD